MTAPVYSDDDYLSAIKQLLPRGRAWLSDGSSTRERLLRGLAATWTRVNQADANLLIDAFPATAQFLLPEWEASLGLPDPCAGLAPTIALRQAQVVQRLTDAGGQSRAHYIDVAAQLGFTISITQFAPFRAGQSHAGDSLGGPWSFYTWQVNAPLQSTSYFRAGMGAAGEPLQSWGNDLLECAISELAPAHTSLLFGYGFDLAEGWGIDFVSDVFHVRPIGSDPAVGAFSTFWTTTRASTASYRTSAGLLATVANDTPRVDYDPDGSVAGLLIERAATNKIIRSEDLTDAAWTKNACSITANAATAADGTLTADKIVEDVANAEHRVRQTLATAAGDTVSYSTFAQKAERSIIELRLLDQASVGDLAAAWYDLNAGTVSATIALGATTGLVATIEQWLGGIYRCTLTAKPNGTMVNCIVDTFLCTASGGSPIYLGNGTSGAYVWGEQFESGIPTSYIKTLGATVTRAADRISRVLGGEFSQLRGTVFAECRLGDGNNAANQFIVDHGDGTNNNGATLFSATNGTARMSINSGGGFAGLAFTAVAIPDGAKVKIAGAWQLNDVSIARDGTLGTPDASAPLPIGLARVDLGATYNGTQACERLWIRRADYRPIRQPDVDLQSRTA